MGANKIYTINNKHSDVDGYFILTGSDVGLCDFDHTHTLEEIPTLATYFKANIAPINHTHNALKNIRFNNTSYKHLIKLESDNTINLNTNNNIISISTQQSQLPVKAVIDCNDSNSIIINTESSIVSNGYGINFGGDFS